MALLSVLIATLVIVACRSWKVGVIVVTWLALVSGLSWYGVLDTYVPPRPLFVLLPTLAGFFLLIRLCGTSLCAIPIGVLVGVQAFRIPVELLIHRAVMEGVAPPQMTWFPGLNYDVVTGVSALLLAPVAGRLPRWVLHLWNGMGLCLLAWVVFVGVLSLPTPLQQFKPDNTWIAFFPYIGLPVVLVSTALLGHLVLLKKLRSTARPT